MDAQVAPTVRIIIAIVDAQVAPTVHIITAVADAQAAPMARIITAVADAQAVPMAHIITAVVDAELAQHNVAMIVIRGVMIPVFLDAEVPVIMLAIAATQCVVMAQRALAQGVAQHVE